jgi:prolipoprotein diacylglyceryltransferase
LIALLTFPVYLSFGTHRIHPHVFFDALAYVAGFATYLVLRRHSKDFLPGPLRLALVAAATAGATIGAKLLFILEDPELTRQSIQNPAYLLGGKTIVGALLGGLIAVEAVKHSIGIKQSTSDLYAVPLAVGIAVGRIGCFLTGLSDNTCGIPTSLPWGVDFGDGIRRHPTQLYEILFLALLIPVLGWIMKQIRASRRFHSGDVFKFFMVAYMAFRLLCDFIKPYPRVAPGLGTIQWACLLVLLYYASDMRRWLLPGLKAPASNGLSKTS